MVRRTEPHQNKHHFRHHVIPEKNEGLDMGLEGQRFATGRFARIIADSIEAITSTISTLLTLTTGLTLSFLGAGVVHTDSSGVVSTGPVVLTSEVSGDLPFANLAQGSALSVLGVTGNATADVASIAAGTDNQVLRRSGTAVEFGQVNLASSDAVTGSLAVANGGTAGTTAATARAGISAAPLDPTFVTLSTNTELTNERVLTAGNGVVFTDAGAGSTLTVALTGGSLANPIATQVFGG